MKQKKTALEKPGPQKDRNQVSFVPGLEVTQKAELKSPSVPLFSKGEFFQKLLNPSLKKRGRGDLFSELDPHVLFEVFERTSH